MGKGVSAAPRQICILRMSTPGEVALTLPAVTLLSRHFPGARITYLTSTDCVPVLAAGLPAGIHIEGLPLPRGAGDYGEFRRLYA